MTRLYLVLRDSATVAHIHHKFAPALVDGDQVPALWAKCGQLFPEPGRWSYWRPRGRRRVCGHCARVARREARELLAAANGLP